MHSGRLGLPVLCAAVATVHPLRPFRLLLPDILDKLLVVAAYPFQLLRKLLVLGFQPSHFGILVVQQLDVLFELFAGIQHQLNQILPRQRHQNGMLGLSANLRPAEVLAAFILLGVAEVGDVGVFLAGEEARGHIVVVAGGLLVVGGIHHGVAMGGGHVVVLLAALAVRDVGWLARSDR